MRTVFKSILGGRLSGWLVQRVVSRSIRRALARLPTGATALGAESVIQLLFSKDFVHLRPWQHPEELLLLARQLQRTRPRVVLEIGTASGGTLFLAACLAHPQARLISIDLPFGPYGGGYPEWKVPLYQSFARPGQQITLIRGDSHCGSVFQHLRSVLANRPVDYLFIDGDHSYAGVRQDFETYQQVLADGAMVAFHDIVEERSQARHHQVSRYWDEIKTGYAHAEFIKDPSQDLCGLGVLTFRRDKAIEDTDQPTSSSRAQRSHPDR